MTGFFLKRPIMAIVCSAVIVIMGLVAIPILPISQYPQITPPVVTVTAFYLGASPESVETAVTTPLENAINGVEGLRYISSTSSQGTSTVTATFNLGTNLDIAATDVQNAVQSSFGLLPNEVKQTGVQVNKNNGSFVMALALTSTGAHDATWLSNYAELDVVNDLKRVPGVSGVQLFGQRRYAMRVWLNPHALQGRGLTTSDVLGALQEQNVNVAAGSIGGTPQSPNQYYTYTVNAIGRLSTPDEFKNIILRSDPNGGFTKLGDVARVELGAEDYSSFVRFDGNQNVIGMGVQQLPSANALSVAQGVKAKLNELQQKFPPDVKYEVAFDTTLFVQESIKEVVITLLLSILLVVLVIYLFLQSGRATIIPASTIPISLIGTFFFFEIFNFSINTITLFGLTLAAGLVVDDAIVVIENIARYMKEHKMGGISGAKAAMDEIQSAVVASSLVLFSVFTPVAFFPGTTGLLYKQFALTITASIMISLFAALTLAPVLSSILLYDKPDQTKGFFGWFNRNFASFKERYRNLLPTFAKRRWIVVTVFAIALVLTAVLFKSTPTGFIPQEDQGWFLTVIQAPEGTSLANEHKVAVKAENIIRNTPGVEHVFNVGGFSFTGAAPNRGIAFVLMKPWDERSGWTNWWDLQPGAMLYYGKNAIMPQFAKQIPEAGVFAFQPPAIFGVDTFGFSFEVEDRGNVGLPYLYGVVQKYIGATYKAKPPFNLITQYAINNPELQVNIDRNKVKAMGASLGDVFNTMQTNLGSVYVNDFNYNSRAYRVYVQADEKYRSQVSDLQDLFVRSNTGGLTPVSAVASVGTQLSPPIITHYNLFRNIEISGQIQPGHGSGEAIADMKQLAEQIDPPGVGYQWSGLTLDEIESGNQTIIIFALGILFVFLVLSAQYESFIDPLIVILAVPAALLGALIFLNYRSFTGFFLFMPWVPVKDIVTVLGGALGISQDAYAEVGYVMLIGLASKSAILIVEFANQQVKAGADVVTAAIRAATTRLRPILMTSIAFVIAMLPLVYATGAGSAARHSLGTVVFGGMLFSTFVNLAVTPVLYIIIKGWEMRGHKPTGGNGKYADGQALIPDDTAPAAVH